MGEAGRPIDPEQKAVDMNPSRVRRDFASLLEILFEQGRSVFSAERPEERLLVRRGQAV